MSIVLLNMQGQEVSVLMKKMNVEKGDHEQELVMPIGIPSGPYLIALKGLKHRITVKVIM